MDSGQNPGGTPATGLSFLGKKTIHVDLDDSAN